MSVATTASSARLTLLGQWGRFAIQIAGFVLLARLLPPADFGLVAMVASIVTVALLVADFGLGLAGIQARELSSGQKSTLLLLNLAAGVVGAGAVAAAGPALAAFYDEPRLVALAAVLAVPLLLSSAAVQFRVEVNRAGRFGVLAVQDVVSAAAGLGAGVAVAIAGGGYWALAAQPVVQAAVLLALAVPQAHWRPGRPAPWREVVPLVRFGGNNLALHLANLTSTTVDVMALGRAQGATELGLYSRASQLVTMIFTQIASPLTRVALPRLAQAEDDAAFAAALRRTQTVLAWGLIAVVSFGAALAPAGVVVAFGADWAAMGPLVQVLCAGAAFQAVGYVYYWALLARARTGVLLLAELPGRAVMVAGAIACAPLGAGAVAVVMSIGQAVIFAGGTLAVRRAGIRVAPLVAAAAAPLAVFAVAAVAAVAAGLALGLPPLGELLVVAGVWAAVVGAALVVPPVRAQASAAVRSVRG